MFNNKKNNRSLSFPSEFDKIVGELGENMIIQRDNQYGIINQYGEEILKPMYKDIIPVEDNTFVVEKDNSFYIFFSFTLLPSAFETREAAFQIASAYVA